MTPQKAEYLQFTMFSVSKLPRLVSTAEGKQLFPDWMK